jgi:hypothetical protein
MLDRASAPLDKPSYRMISILCTTKLGRNLFGVEPTVVVNAWS